MPSPSDRGPQLPACCDRSTNSLGFPRHPNPLAGRTLPMMERFAVLPAAETPRLRLGHCWLPGERGQIRNSGSARVSIRKATQPPPAAHSAPTPKIWTRLLICNRKVCTMPPKTLPWAGRSNSSAGVQMPRIIRFARVAGNRCPPKESRSNQNTIQSQFRPTPRKSIT